MKMTRLINFMLLLTLAMFLTNGFTEDVPSGAIAQIDTGKGPVNAIMYSPAANRLASGSSDGTVFVWDLDKIVSTD